MAVVGLVCRCCDVTVTTQCVARIVGTTTAPINLDGEGRIFIVRLTCSHAAAHDRVMRSASISRPHKG